MVSKSHLVSLICAVWIAVSYATILCCIVGIAIAKKDDQSPGDNFDSYLLCLLFNLEMKIYTSHMTKLPNSGQNSTMWFTGNPR